MEIIMNRSKVCLQIAELMFTQTKPGSTDQRVFCHQEEENAPQKTHAGFTQTALVSQNTVTVLAGKEQNM